MIEQNFTYFNETSGKAESTMAPALVHANYCDQKIDEFKNLGLWLYDKSSSAAHGLICKPYDVKNTHFYRTDWEGTIKRSVEDISQVKSKFANGQLVRIHKKSSIYLVQNQTLFAFPNADTFVKMGFEWKNVNHVRLYNFIKFFPVGPDLPSL